MKVIRLLGRSTVEEIILKRAEAKLRLTNAVIEGGQFSAGTSKDGSQLLADSNIQVLDKSLGLFHTLIHSTEAVALVIYELSM